MQCVRVDTESAVRRDRMRKAEDTVIREETDKKWYRDMLFEKLLKI